LKEEGIVYCSFKYGEKEEIRNGRFFNDFDEDKFLEFYPKDLFDVSIIYLSGDDRPGKDNEFWLNVILEKK
jgi:hypothetical protein